MSQNTKKGKHYDEVFQMSYSNFKQLIVSYIGTNDQALRSLIYELLPDYRKDRGYKLEDYKQFIHRIKHFAQVISLARESALYLDLTEQIAFEENLHLSISAFEESMSIALKSVLEKQIRMYNATL